jgi:hypothetical protein
VCSSRMEIIRVWVPGLAGLRGTGLQSEYCAGLCRLWEHDWAEQRSFRAVQALGALPAKQRFCRAGDRGPAKRSSCRAVQVLGVWRSRDRAGLCRPEWGGSWPGGDRKCLWLPSLKGSSHGDPAVLRGGSLG